MLPNLSQNNLLLFLSNPGKYNTLPASNSTVSQTVTAETPLPELW